MKKLIMAAAIVCATVVSQAATISWTTDAARFCDPTTKEPTATVTGGSLILVLMKGGVNWDSYTEIATAEKTGTTQPNNSTTVKPSSLSSSVGRVTGTLKEAYESGANNYVENNDVLALMFKDDKGNISKLKYLDGTDADITYTVAGLAGNTTSLSSQKFTASGNFTTASVPEPTSAMLLLLGVAGMALKRKRA